MFSIFHPFELSLRSSLRRETKFHTHTKRQV
jgi:hypothetical protein